MQREARAYNAAIAAIGSAHYDELLPDGADPVATIEEGNAELQLTVANAAYRKGQMRYGDAASTKQALEESASGYLTVLKNGAWHQDAAYNYEYLARLRDEQAKGRRPPEGNDEAQKADNGQGGAPSEATSQEGFEVYIPLESTEKPRGRRCRQGAAEGTQGLTSGDDAQLGPTLDFATHSLRRRRPTCGCCAVPALLVVLWGWRVWRRRRDVAHFLRGRIVPRARAVQPAGRSRVLVLRARWPARC